MESPPYLVSWNITQRCNLHCAHCYLDASPQQKEGELSTSEGLRVIDQIASLASDAMLVFSGGEPLLREDIFDLCRHAALRGLMVVVGTNGTLLEEETLARLEDCGCSGIGISLDSLLPAVHDAFRGSDGAWLRTRHSIEACQRQDIPFHIQTTLTPQNYAELPSLIEFSFQAGARVFNLFFLISAGRGQYLYHISPKQYEDALVFLISSQSRYPQMKLRARCAPQAVRLQKTSLPESLSPGCLAGTHYFRITPAGKVTPCPYFPLEIGDLRREELAEVWAKNEVLRQLRQNQWQGRCGVCEFAFLCRGCRARAFAATGDYLAEDVWCTYQPTGKAPDSPGEALQWQEEARKRLEKAPAFVRHRVTQQIEGYAKEKGYPWITPEVLEEFKAEFASKLPFLRTRGKIP